MLLFGNRDRVGLFSENEWVSLWKAVIPAVISLSEELLSPWWPGSDFRRGCFCSVFSFSAFLSCSLRRSWSSGWTSQPAQETGQWMPNRSLAHGWETDSNLAASPGTWSGGHQCLTLTLKRRSVCYTCYRFRSHHTCKHLIPKVLSLPWETLGHTLMNDLS